MKKPRLSAICQLSFHVFKKKVVACVNARAMNFQSGADPKRPNKIYRYKPSSNSGKPGDDPSADYLNLLGMIFSMCGLMMRIKWAAWAAVYCSFISFANARASEDGRQMFSSFLLSVSAVVMSYLQNPQPMAASW